MSGRVPVATLLALALAAASVPVIASGAAPRPGAGVTLPVVMEKVEPAYPASLRSRGEQGTVTLDALIRADGTVGDVTVRSSDGAEFTGAAVAAAEKWRYRPALLDGRPIDFYVTIVVRFSIDGNPSDVRSRRECYGDDEDGPAETVDEPPRVEWKEPVVLPERLEDVGGEVELEFEVCRDGRVRSVTLLRASDATLGRAAQDAARRWAFAPAMRDGRPVATLHKAALKIRPSKP